MAKSRAKKSKKTNGDSMEYEKVLTMRVSIQEDTWLEELTKKHQARANKSELVRMLIRKAAAEAGLPGA